MQAYCTFPYSCVKCGEEHNNRNCLKKPKDKSKCANCQGEHLANYVDGRSSMKISNCKNSEQWMCQRIRPTHHLHSVTLEKRTHWTFAEVVAVQPNSVDDAVTQPTSIYTQQVSKSRIEMLLEKLLQQQEEQTDKLIELLTTIITKLIKWITRRKCSQKIHQ